VRIRGSQTTQGQKKPEPKLGQLKVSKDCSCG
jgi:hypothetical protein